MCVGLLQTGMVVDLILLLHEKPQGQGNDRLCNMAVTLNLYLTLDSSLQICEASPYGGLLMNSQR